MTDHLARYLEGLIHVALIDALRDYIRCDAQITEDLLFEGSITREQARAYDPHIGRCKAVLRELEAHEIDPTLGNLLPHRRAP